MPCDSPASPGLCPPQHVLRLRSCGWAAFCCVWGAQHPVNPKGLWVGPPSWCNIPSSEHCISWRGTAWAQNGTAILPQVLGAVWRWRAEGAYGWLWLQIAISLGFSSLALPPESPTLSPPCPAVGRERRCWDRTGGLVLFWKHIPSAQRETPGVLRL